MTSTFMKRCCGQQVLGSHKEPTITVHHPLRILVRVSGTSAPRERELIRQSKKPQTCVRGYLIVML